MPENSENLTLDAKIEAYLFFAGEEVSFAKLTSLFEVSKDEILQAIETLSLKLAGRGLAIIQTQNQVSLRTANSMHEMFSGLVKKDENAKLSQASGEVLALIAYLGEVSRAQIDYIRGVNSSYSIRSLVSRMLIDRNEKNKYFLTTETLAHLGINKKEDLPEYQSNMEKFASFLSMGNNK